MAGRDRNLRPLRSEKSRGGSLLSADHPKTSAKTLLLEMSPEFGAVVDSKDDYICSVGVA
jgi:hypothetical protein